MTFGLTLLFMILVFLRPQEWLIPAMYGWPILEVVFYLSMLTLLLESHEKRVLDVSRIPQTYLLVGLWFATLMSHIANTYLDGLLATYADTLKFAVFTILLFAIIDRPSRLRAVLTVFVAMACVMAWHAILQQQRGYGFAGQTPLLTWRPGIATAVPRSQFFGIFGDPNDLGQILACALPFGFALTRRLNLWSVACGGAIAWLLFRGIAGTWSRGTQMGLIVTGLYMALFIFPVRWQSKLTFIFIFAGLLACPLAGGLMDQSARDRVVFWGEANVAFKSHPFFGVGYNMLREYLSGRASHNAFVSSYAELGLFGHFFWFSLLMLGLRQAWVTRVALVGVPGVEAAWMRRFAGLAVAGMAGYTVSAYFLSRAFVYPTFFMFAILGALPHVARRWLAEQGLDSVEVPEDSPQTIVAMGIIGTVSSIVYVYVSIILLNRAYA
jgi:putative inorganic carbon (hco3(-)) transporter